MMPDFKALTERVTQNEGYRRDVYKCTAGYDTVGIGFALKDLEIDKDLAHKIIEWQIKEGLIHISEEHSKKKLAKELVDKHLELLEKWDWYGNLPPEIKSVVVEMCFNLGDHGFSKFKKAIAHMKSKEWQLAADEMLDSLWARQVKSRANRLATIVRDHG